MADSNDRILKGPLPWEVLRFGFPLALGMALQNAFNLVDAYLINQLPFAEANAAVGAIGVCDQLAAIGSIVSYGISTATATLISQQKGAGDEEGVRRTAWQSIWLVGFLSLFFAILGVFAPVLAENVIGLKGAVLDVAIRYLRIILPGGFSMFFLLHLGSIQRALGSAKTPVALLVLGNVLNVFFAVIWLYGPEAPNATLAWGAKIAAAIGVPKKGMEGAAWATVLARTLALLPNIVILVKRFSILPKDHRGPDFGEMKRILHIAWPSSAQFVLRICAVLLTSSLVARYYSTDQDQAATTAMGLVFRLDTIAMFVAMGWGSAAQTFVGQNLGAKAEKRATSSGWITVLYDGITNVGIYAGVLSFGERFLRYFGKDDHAIRIALEYVAIVAPSYFLIGPAIVLGNAMAGAGATKTTLKLDAGVLLGFQLPVSLICVLAVHVPLRGLFACVSATALCGAIVYVIAYARGRWKDHAHKTLPPVAPPAEAV
ncbi:MAG: MATE family efflux transporter [Polyangiaceae bacterium]